MKNLIFIILTLLLIKIVPSYKALNTTSGSYTFKSVHTSKPIQIAITSREIIPVVHAEEKAITPAPTAIPDKTQIYTPSGYRASNKVLVMAQVDAIWGADQEYAMDQIMVHEAHYNNLAVNPSGGACGMFQALPCSKMGCSTLDDVQCQIRFGINYIKVRYGNPNNAWMFWQGHNWY